MSCDEVWKRSVFMEYILKIIANILDFIYTFIKDPMNRRDKKKNSDYED
jgi:hypothetical protein